jgi:hypothetical protein
LCPGHERGDLTIMKALRVGCCPADGGGVNANRFLFLPERRN